MIYGTLAHWSAQKRWFPQSFERALAFAFRPDLAALEDGTYEIEGRDIFAMLQQPMTEPESARKFELHREYIDIQLLLSGSEKHLYAPGLPDILPGIPPDVLEDRPEVLEDRLDESDYAFYAAPAQPNTVFLRPGDFVIYLPGEMHCPNCAPDPLQPEKIRKVVFKVRQGL